MKRITMTLMSILALCLGLAACGGAHAQTLYAHAQFGPADTVDLLHAKVVDLTAGAQKVYDQNGGIHSGAFVNNSAFTGGDFFARYIQASGTNLYYNVTAMTGVRCVGANTMIDWQVGAAQTVADGCAFFNQIFARSRR